MFVIHKITSHPVVDFAAAELKKYLRMMMPEGGDIDILHTPNATDGFRLGLMQDFGLDVSDVEDTELDDILYMETDEEGGIIAGDNPRSVLLAVYEYLRQNGCRWLMPGSDGEYIPLQNIVPVSYRHVPSCRYRGQCNEGGEYQEDMLAAIDFTPKVGMNVFMLEFEYPMVYYKRYYGHLQNEENRPAEHVTKTQVLQWKRECEVEIARRGLQFHDIGHGWHADAFGIDSSVRAGDGDNEKLVTPEARQYLAQIGGERKLHHGVPNYSQPCLGQPEARRRIADYVARYAENHANSDYLHVWLGDATNNHCECEICRQKRPSDWYIMLLNEIDEALAAKNLDTRIVFIVYTDTTWAPLTETLRDPHRFALLFAPITRRYTVSLPGSVEEVEIRPFQLNQNKYPGGMNEYLAHLGEWKKNWNGACVAYEYHFYKPCYHEVSGVELSRRINEDVRMYKDFGVNGIIEDGTQRAFFPNGLAFYTYARSLYDLSLSAEEIAEEYLSMAYGADWRLFYDYLDRVGKAFNFPYMSREASDDMRVSPYYSPTHAASLREAVPALLEEGEALAASHYSSPIRVQTVTVRLFAFYLEYIRHLARVMEEKALGHDAEAKAAFEEMRRECGKKEIYFEKWYDHFLAFFILEQIIGTKSNLDVDRDVIYDN